MGFRRPEALGRPTDSRVAVALRAAEDSSPHAMRCDVWCTWLLPPEAELGQAGQAGAEATEQEEEEGAEQTAAAPAPEVVDEQDAAAERDIGAGEMDVDRVAKPALDDSGDAGTGPRSNLGATSAAVQVRAALQTGVRRSYGPRVPACRLPVAM